MPPLNGFQKKCIALAVSQALVISAAEAAVITVNGTDPVTDCTLRNAIISANTDVSGGECSAGSGADVVRIHSQTINIDSAAYFSPTGYSAFYITSDITIEGKPFGAGGETNGGLIKNSGINDFRLFRVESGHSLVLNDVVVTGGQLVAGGENGGGIFVNNGTLTLNNSVLTDNRVAFGSGSDPQASGGAVFATGSNAQVNLNYSMIRSNTASDGGGIALEGGADLAIYRSVLDRNSATDRGGVAHTLEGSNVTLTDSSVSSNTAGSGGAIYLGLAGGEGTTSLTVQGGEFSGNRSSGSGGAIAAKYGDVSVTDTQFFYNRASFTGGAIAMAIGGTGSLEVSGSAFVANRVIEGGELGASSTAAGFGGAIAIFADNTHSITNSTISGNIAATGGAIIAAAGSLSLTNTTLIGGEGVPATMDSAALTPSAIMYAASSASVTFNNSVAAFGGEGFLYGGEYGAGAQGSVSILPGRVLCNTEGSATITSGSANHFEDASCGQASNGDPGIGRLSYGTASSLSFTVGTQTDSNTLRNAYLSASKYHTPVFNSPLINAANTTICGGEQTDGVDQRGLPRGVAECDIGSTESTEISLIVNTTSDDVNSTAANCSLRDALLVAGGESSGGPRKAKGKVLSQRANATCLGQADITSIQFDPTVFPAGGKSTIALTGYLPRIRSAVSIQGPGSQALTISQGGEGRILSATRSHFYLSDITLANGSAYSGAGLSVYSSHLELSSVVISGNQGRRSGGVSLYATDFTIDKTTISGNAADNAGVGGLSIGGRGLGVLSNSTVSGNTSSDTTVGDLSNYRIGEQAGGILVQEGHLTVIRNSTISGNSSSRTGGGIGVNNASVFLVNSTVSNNIADVYGGGIHVQQLIRSDSKYSTPPSFPALISSIISGNRKGSGPAGVALGVYGSDYSSVSLELDGGVLSPGQQLYSYVGRSLFGDSSLTYGESIYANVKGSTTLSNSQLATSLDAFGNPNPSATALNRILHPLRNNGGSTLTHDLVDGSPAIDGGEQSFCSSGGFFEPFTEDQRGFGRNDGACDIGSVEYVESACFVIPTANSRAVAFCL